MTTIDPKKVNLQESDIEDWLYDNPESVVVNGMPVCHWIGRQVKVPSGIVDLVGLSWGKGHSYPSAAQMSRLVVVEVKNVPLDARAICQVGRYAADIERGITTLELEHSAAVDIPVCKVLVGPSISEQVFVEAEAHDVNVMCFGVSLSLNIMNTVWSPNYTKRRGDELAEMVKGGWFETIAFHGMNNNALFQDLVGPVMPTIYSQVEGEEVG